MTRELLNSLPTLARAILFTLLSPHYANRSMPAVFSIIGEIRLRPLPSASPLVTQFEGNPPLSGYNLQPIIILFPPCTLSDPDFSAIFRTPDKSGN